MYPIQVQNLLKIRTTTIQTYQVVLHLLKQPPVLKKISQISEILTKLLPAPKDSILNLHNQALMH